MKEKSINSTGMKAMTNVKSPGNLITLKNNKSFCNYFINHNSMTSLVDNNEEYDSSQSKLIYDFSGTSSPYDDVLGKIIDLLFQLRAAQSDQNVFVQNNTVVREQILNQLQNEILKVNHKLSKSQIKNLEVISSNSFDEDKLNEILKSFLDSSKKKSPKDDLAPYGPGILNNINLRTLENIRRTYSSVLSAVVNEKTLTHRIFNTQNYEDKTFRTELINVKPPESKIPDSKPESSNRAYSGKLINRNIIQSTEETTPESTQFYEENIIKKISKISPRIKKTKKLTHVDFLTKVNSFVKNILESTGIETKSVYKNIEKIKDSYKNKTIYESNDIFDTSHRLINRENINVESENLKNSEIEKQNLKKYSYLISDKFNEIIKDKNIISKEFRIKNQKYQRMVDFVENKNNIIFEKDANLQKISRLITSNSKNLIYKTTNLETDHLQHTDTNAIINKILETKHIKDIKEQNKEIQKNINIIKHSDVHEKYKIKDNKTYENEIYYDKSRPLTHKVDTVKLDSEIINKEDIYKVIPKLKNETKLVKTEVQTNVFKNITKFLEPIISKRSTFSTINTELNREHIGKKLTYLTDKVGNVREKIVINDSYKTSDSAYKNPPKDYMVYKEEIYERAPEVHKKKEDKPTPIEKIKNKEVKKFIPPKEEKLDLPKIKKEIIASTLKREDVEKMIRSQISKINIDSISRRIVKDVKDSIELENIRNGIFN